MKLLATICVIRQKRSCSQHVTDLAQPVQKGRLCFTSILMTCKHVPQRKHSARYKNLLLPKVMLKNNLRLEDDSEPHGTKINSREVAYRL